ncbi:DUF5302 domain-containing protein [Rhodococcus sp. NPDC060086]|uniref:DUF5302 domain-containing protein n=1 Tax=unclassified Rhodococcus (in: high G+C Gram-positive bacteria) TaxID=192944 RepID=UPI00364C50CE
MTDPAKERIKEEFLAALERKKQSKGSGTAHLDATSKANGPHANTDHHRQFRRKSG